MTNIFTLDTRPGGRQQSHCDGRPIVIVANGQMTSEIRVILEAADGSRTTNETAELTTTISRSKPRQLIKEAASTPQPTPQVRLSET